MTLEDYKRNLKGVNDGSDFSDEFLVWLTFRSRGLPLTCNAVNHLRVDPQAGNSDARRAHRAARV